MISGNKSTAIVSIGRIKLAKSFFSPALPIECEREPNGCGSFCVHTVSVCVQFAPLQFTFHPVRVFFLVCIRWAGIDNEMLEHSNCACAIVWFYGIDNQYCTLEKHTHSPNQSLKWFAQSKANIQAACSRIARKKESQGKKVFLHNDDDGGNSERQLIEKI